MKVLAVFWYLSYVQLFSPLFDLSLGSHYFRDGYGLPYESIGKEGSCSSQLN